MFVGLDSYWAVELVTRVNKTVMREEDTWHWWVTVMTVDQGYCDFTVNEFYLFFNINIYIYIYYHFKIKYTY